VPVSVPGRTHDGDSADQAEDGKRRVAATRRPGAGQFTTSFHAVLVSAGIDAVKIPRCRERTAWGLFALIAAILSAITTIRVNSIRHGLQVEMAVPRVGAYRNLWALTRRGSIVQPADQDERNHLEESIFEWYFEDGQGIFLSDASRDIVHGLQAQLRDDTVDWVGVCRTYSTLRLSSKNDVGVFTGARRTIRRRFTYSLVNLTTLDNLTPSPRRPE
jgi:hypothetical protein